MLAHRTRRPSWDIPRRPTPRHHHRRRPLPAQHRPTSPLRQSCDRNLVSARATSANWRGKPHPGKIDCQLGVETLRLAPTDLRSRTPSRRNCHPSRVGAHATSAVLTGKPQLTQGRLPDQRGTYNRPRPPATKCSALLALRPRHRPRGRYVRGTLVFTTLGLYRFVVKGRCAFEI